MICKLCIGVGCILSYNYESHYSFFVNFTCPYFGYKKSLHVLLYSAYVLQHKFITFNVKVGRL